VLGHRAGTGFINEPDVPDTPTIRHIPGFGNVPDVAFF
jgi:hypothetical protein